MLHELENKTALITGAAKRLGREMALTLSDRGINVIVHFDHSDTEASKLRADLQNKGVKAWTIQADFRNPDPSTPSRQGWFLRRRVKMRVTSKASFILFLSSGTAEHKTSRTPLRF